MEESGPDSGGWGPAEEPLFTVETALEQAHFSTVFVALPGGGGAELPESGGQLTKATWNPALHWPPAGNSVFSFHRLGCTWTQEPPWDITPPAATATGTQYASCC